MGNSFDEKRLIRVTQPSTTPTIHEQPSFETEQPEHLSTLSPTSPSHDFDPCAVAKPCSPFYLYKHDSPRPSTEQSHFKNSTSAVHVAVYDVEAATLTPSVSQEKRKGRSDNALFRLWPRRKQCMTKPKEGVRDRFRKLPKWQRISIRVFIALLIIGAIIGIGLGISIRVHGGVYESTNQQASIST